MQLLFMLENIYDVLFFNIFFFSLHFLEISWQLAFFLLHYCHPQGLSCHHFFISLWFFFESKAQSLSPPRLWVKDSKVKSLGLSQRQMDKWLRALSVSLCRHHLCISASTLPTIHSIGT